MLWQVPVCGLMAVVPVVAAVALICKTGKRPPRFVDLWAPSWRNISPFWLLGYRGFVFLLMSCLLIQLILDNGVLSFFYYTQWTFALVVIYFAIGTVISAHGCWIYSRGFVSESEANGFLKVDFTDNKAQNLSLRAYKIRGDEKLPSLHERQLNEKIAGFWGYTMQIVYQISAGTVILTDVIFWGLIVPFMFDEHVKVNLIMIWFHSVNAVFLLIDTALNRMPFPWFGIAYFGLWSCVYMSFQWILHAFGLVERWPYPFMQIATPWAPLWYVAIGLVHIPCFGLYYLIAEGKNSYCSKLFPNSYIKSYCN